MLAILALIISALALGAVFVVPTAIDARSESAKRDAQIAEREARMLQYYVLELDGKLMAGGIIPPGRGYTEWRKERDKEQK